MKKITSLFVLLIIASVAFAQQSANLKIHGYPVYGNQTTHFSHYPRLRNEDFTIQVNYDAADAQAYNQGDYHSFIWASNMHYNLAANDPIDSASMNYCIVAFDTLVDATTLTGYPRNQVVGNMTIDTVQAIVGHVNHSGNPDTIRVSIVGLPDANTILWTTDIVTDTGLSISPTGFHTWIYNHDIVVPVNFSLPSPRNTYGVLLQYFGDKRDTFGFIAGFGDANAATCASNPASLIASQSQYYPNSYAYWVAYGALFPSSQQGDLYYECNGDHNYTAGVDGANYIQNIVMQSSITFTSNLGINDINGSARLLNVYPNPSKDQTNISYSILTSTNVTFNIYDVTGKLVQTIAKGTVAPGKYTQSVDLSKMAPGIYSFSISTTEGKSFGKIAVTK